MTRETVFFDTPARRAMSVMVCFARWVARFAERLEVLMLLLIGAACGLVFAQILIPVSIQI